MTQPFRALVFDAYGTLFNVHSVMTTCEALFPGKGRELSQLWRAKQLEYTWIYAAMGSDASRPAPPFAELTRCSLEFALAASGCNPHLAPRLLDSARRLAPFAEVRENLSALRAGGARLAILSNADPETLEGLVEHAGLSGQF